MYVILLFFTKFYIQRLGCSEKQKKWSTQANIMKFINYYYMRICNHIWEIIHWILNNNMLNIKIFEIFYDNIKNVSTY